MAGFAATMPSRSPALLRATPRQGARHMRLSRAVEDFLNDLQLERSLQTYKAYKSDLHLLVSIATVEAGDKVGAFTPEVVRLYFKKRVDQGLATETLLRARSALNEFAKWMVRQRLVSDNPMLIAAPRFKRPKRHPRPFDHAERQRLLALELSAEETMLRALFFYAGLRVSESAFLRWTSVRLSSATQRGALRIIGKGNKERIVPMFQELDAGLRAWLAAPLVTRRLLEGGLVLERKGLPLRVRRIEYLVAQWGARATVPDCTPHRWRHTCATWLFERGMDPRAVQKFLGHESLETTMQYTAVADAAMEQAMRGVEQAGLLAQIILPPLPTPAKAPE